MTAANVPEVQTLRFRQPLMLWIGGALIALLVVIALLAPVLGTVDPGGVNPAMRNAAPGETITIRLGDGTQTSRVVPMGTDTLGRDLYSRIVYGTRVSLLIAFATALLSGVAGLVIGLFAGYVRWFDEGAMRVMDGVMAIPAILLALAIVAVSEPGILAVVFAIAVPEIPRVVRLVRSLVLKLRGEPFVEAAIGSGTGTLLILMRHILPNTIGPLCVQLTFVAVSAILLEAALSFLGIGVPSDVPSWGNIIADGRQWFRLTPHVILLPGFFIILTALAFNLFGEGLRAYLDPMRGRQE